MQEPGDFPPVEVLSVLMEFSLQELKTTDWPILRNKTTEIWLLDWRRARIHAFLDSQQNGASHLALSEGSLKGMQLPKIGVMPYFGNMLLVHANAVLINDKVPEIVHEFLKAIDCLCVDVQGVGKGHSPEMRKSQRYSLVINHP
jgi:hypothetical protein